VLERARRVYWEKGYEGASLPELLRATGLSRSSLYQAFGDKRSLFLAALDSYLEAGRSELRTTLDEAATPLVGLQRWLEKMVVMARRGRPRRGCLGVNSLVELAPRDSEVRNRLARHEDEVTELYARALRAGVEHGEIRADLDPREGALLLRTIVHGVQVAGRAKIDDPGIDVAKWALEGLRARRTEKGKSDE